MVTGSSSNDIILCNLVELKANGHCCPSTLGPDGKWDYDEIRWAKILDDMIQGFALVKKCIIGDELMYHMEITEEDKIKMNKIYQTRKYTFHSLDVLRSKKKQR